MKPLQIGLLVLVGALGGALIMKFTQRPKAAPAVMATVAAEPVQAPAPAPAAMPVETAPQPSALPEATSPAKPAPVEKSAPAAVPKGHHSRPMLRTSPAESMVAQNQPPAPPPQSPPDAAPQEPAPPITAEPAPAPLAPPEPVAEPAAPPAPEPAPSVTLKTGMTLPVRLGESLSSEHNQAGDTFTATLDAPLTAGGFVIAEKGARLEGRVAEAQKSGMKGKATLALELTRIDTSDGQHVAIKTETVRKQAEAMATGDQVGIVAAAAGIGAIIGAMAGGGKGAAIGAGAGGAAGGGGVMATRNKAVSLPTESKLTFRLSGPVTITERLDR
jgi:outer membrane biosynthesis protein TonB